MTSITHSRGDRTWTLSETNRLIHWNLLEFAPSLPTDVWDLVPQSRRRLLQLRHAKRLPPELSNSVMTEVEKLAGAEFQVSDLPSTLVEISERLLPKPIDVDIQRRIFDYVAAAVGYRIRKPRTKLQADPRWIDRAFVSQRQVFLDWIEVYEHLWIDTRWRDCVMVRYAAGEETTALQAISAERIKRLDRAAAELRETSESGSIPMYNLIQTVSEISGGQYARPALFSLQVEYLAARVAGELPPDHWMRWPLRDSDFFERIARPCENFSNLHEMLQETYNERYCRYLTARPWSSERLIGRILHILLVLEQEEKSDTYQLPRLKGIRWPRVLESGEDQPTSDFKEIASAFVCSERRVSPEAFDVIWTAYQKLRMRRFWEQRASLQMTVFWVVRLLEKMYPHHYEAYVSQVDGYRRFVNMRLRRQDVSSAPADPSLGSPPLDPFHVSRIKDPLMNCVFHSLVFDGRSRLPVSKPPILDDTRLRAQMIVFTVSILKMIWPEPPQTPITTILRGFKPSMGSVKHALSKGRPDSTIRGSGWYAYAAPVVASLPASGCWTLSPDTTKETFHRNSIDDEVSRLLAGLSTSTCESIRGGIGQV